LISNETSTIKEIRGTSKALSTAFLNLYRNKGNMPFPNYL